VRRTVSSTSSSNQPLCCSRRSGCNDRNSLLPLRTSGALSRTSNRCHRTPLNSGCRRKYANSEWKRTPIRIISRNHGARTTDHSTNYILRHTSAMFGRRGAMASAVDRMVFVVANRGCPMCVASSRGLQSERGRQAGF
jgi:hypothetical protein